ncbi:MAG TPA: hypothetical protein VLC06_22720 [Polyangia bacterium]|jgi:hypothetical protein|nr:hypothetical protein [Polyangia bacterium]
MLKLGLPVLFAAGILGCGSSTRAPGSTTLTLPGATQIDIVAGDCAIVNTQPQMIPASTVSYNLVDAYGTDSLEVGIVPSSDTCQFAQYQTFVDDTFTGSAAPPSAEVPAGTYDLDIICQNLAADCLISSVTWSATY